MAHKRKDIRNAIVAMLSNHTSAGTNVYPSRVLALWTDDLPAILVYSKEEAASRTNNASSQSLRNTTFTIQVHVAVTTDLESALDDICNEVETILSGDPELQSTALDCFIASTSIDLSVEGETPTGVATLTYNIRYLV